MLGEKNLKNHEDTVELFYKMVFVNTPTPLLLTNRNGDLLQSNTAAQTLLGYDDSELASLKFQSLVPSDLQELIKHIWHSFIQEQSQEGIFILKTKLQQTIYVSYSFTYEERADLCIAALQPLATHSCPDLEEAKAESVQFVQQQLVEKITQQEKELYNLSNSEKHFYNLFENAPVPLLEVDYSQVKSTLEQNRDKYGDSILKYFNEHPSEAMDLMDLRTVKEVNKRCLSFFKAKNRNDIKQNLSRVYSRLSVQQLALTFDAVLHGEKYIKFETQTVSFDGDINTAIMRLSTDTHDYSRTFISFEDISDIKKTQEDLEIRVKMRTYELEKANKELRMEVKSREQIARDLRQSEARYRQLNAIYPVGIFHTDKNGKNIYVNSKACEIQGIKANEARGYGWVKNIHPEDRERVLTTWKNAIQYGVPINIDYRFIHDGKTTWVNGQTVPEYDEKGNIAGYVGILADITKQREAEEQIKQNQIEIAHFSRLNSMGEVASGIAHELNQPLTAIINYTSGCKRRLQDIKVDIPKEIVTAIDQSIVQAQRAGEIIHHLKDFLRKGALSKKEIDINAAINDVLMFINRPISQANIDVHLELDKLLPTISADKIHIEQVIINIINNAVDAIVEANSKRREIDIKTSVCDDKEHIKISISDTGPGIAPNLIDNVFNPFVTTKDDGMGIGLSLCYNIVDKHSGKITVTSKVDVGTTFNIILPLK